MRISDWSSDVCSSDLSAVELLRQGLGRVDVGRVERHEDAFRSFGHGTIHKSVTKTDRKSVVLGKSVSVRVDLGGSRIIKKKKILDSKHVSSIYSTTKHITNKPILLQNK